MTDHSKGFDRKLVVDPYGRDRLALEARRVEAIKAQASPPPAMIAAPVAPARGPQQLVPTFTVSTGGMRRIEGSHWQGLSPLAAAVAQARLRHDAKGGDSVFVAPYGPGQIAMAEFYAALVEWREGSALRCSSFEAGREGGGSGQFIDTFIQRGITLGWLRDQIGNGVAMSPRRNMDRDNARCTITVRAAVDMVCVGAQDLTDVLRRYGWTPDGKNRKVLRAAICGALDRMQGYSDPPCAK